MGVRPFLLGLLLLFPVVPGCIDAPGEDAPSGPSSSHTYTVALYSPQPFSVSLIVPVLVADASGTVPDDTLRALDFRVGNGTWSILNTSDGPRLLLTATAAPARFSENWTLHLEGVASGGGADWSAWRFSGGNASAPPAEWAPGTSLPLGTLTVEVARLEASAPVEGLFIVSAIREGRSAAQSANATLWVGAVAAPVIGRLGDIVLY